MQIKFNPALLRTQNLLKMWQSINGLIDQRTSQSTGIFTKFSEVNLQLQGEWC